MELEIMEDHRQEDHRQSKSLFDKFRGIIALGYKHALLLYAGYKIARHLYEKNYLTNQGPEILAIDYKATLEPLKPDLYSSEIDETEENDHQFSDVDQIYRCPISDRMMKVPYVLTSCGHSFEKRCVLDWVQEKGECPVCGKKAVLDNLLPNFSLKDVLASKRQEILKRD